MKAVMAVVTAVLIGPAIAAASGVEDALAPFCDFALGEDMAEEVCLYQYDGRRHGDASNRCGDLANDRFLFPNDPHPEPFGGLLVPADDRSDHYPMPIDIPPGQTFRPVMVMLKPHPAIPDAKFGVPMDLTVRDPSCANVVAEGWSAPDGKIVAFFEARFPGLYDVEVWTEFGPAPLGVHPPFQPICHGTCNLNGPAGYAVQAV